LALILKQGLPKGIIKILELILNIDMVCFNILGEGIVTYIWKIQVEQVSIHLLLSFHLTFEFLIFDPHGN
jgi:hypothetical protein